MTVFLCLMFYTSRNDNMVLWSKLVTLAWSLWNAFQIHQRSLVSAGWYLLNSSKLYIHSRLMGIWIQHLMTAKQINPENGNYVGQEINNSIHVRPLAPRKRLVQTGLEVNQQINQHLNPEAAAVSTFKYSIFKTYINPSCYKNHKLKCSPETMIRLQLSFFI